MKIFLFLSIFWVFTLNNCNSIDVLTHEKTFNSKTIEKGKVIFFGVVSAVQKKLDNYNPLLEKHFRVIQKSWVIEPVSKGIQKVGRKKYQEILNSYRKNSILTPVQLIYLSDKMESQFLILARIESDKVIKNRFPDESGIWYRERWPNERIIYTMVRRVVTLSLSIYDLDLKKLVWQGVSTKRLSNYLEFKSTGEWDGTTFYYKAFNEYPFPPEPELRLILDKLFKSFAEEL
ncbi:MAG: hypothetical protein IEMM0008_1685 [bacterium]|nr:MAG: hypothetical protein IEMM0008_1685 [bacterium]